MRMVSAGADYLRITVKPCTALLKFKDVWGAEMSELVLQGAKETSWRFKGYDGRRVDCVMQGSRDDGFIFEASGVVCQKLFEAVKGIEFHGNIPRIDAGFAIEDKEETFPRPVALFRQIDDKEATSGKARKRRCDLIKGAKGADTIAFNKRGGGVFTRIYDAHAAHPETFGNSTFKFECEYTNQSGRRVWEQFVNGENQQKIAAGLVINQLQKMDLDFPFHDLATPIQIKSDYKAPDVERALRWFANQIRPKIRWLVELGYADIVAQCLGLEEIRLKDVSADDALFASLAPRGLEIPTLSGQDVLPCDRKAPHIGLMARIHSQARDRKKSKGGVK